MKDRFISRREETRQKNRSIEELIEKVDRITRVYLHRARCIEAKYRML